MEIFWKDCLAYRDVRLADSFWSRFRGLMGQKRLGREEGLLLRDCASIHCFFMRFPIDTVYLDGNYRVVGLETVAPWRVGHLFRGAKHTLEVTAGSAPFSVGDELRIIPDP